VPRRNAAETRWWLEEENNNPLVEIREMKLYLEIDVYFLPGCNAIRAVTTVVRLDKYIETVNQSDATRRRHASFRNAPHAPVPCLTYLLHVKSIITNPN
jgi:hypothetical protein